MLHLSNYSRFQHSQKFKKKKKWVNKIRRIFPPRNKPRYLKISLPLHFPSNAIRNIGTVRAFLYKCFIGLHEYSDAFNVLFVSLERQFQSLFRQNGIRTECFIYRIYLSINRLNSAEKTNRW